MKIAKTSKRRPRVAIFLDAQGGYHDQLQQGVAAYHHLHGPWELLHEMVDLIRNDMNRLGDVDGAIFSLGQRYGVTSHRLLKAIVRAGTPAVDLTPEKSNGPFPQVRADNVAVG